MIVPMKKISLVVLKNERRNALKSLRKLGVLHVEELQGSSDELSCFREQNSIIEKAIGILSEVKTGKKEAPRQTVVGKECAFEIAKSIIALADEKKSCFDRITSSSAELERFARWGSVNPDDFRWLSDRGVHLSMYEIPSDKYTVIGENVKTILLNRDKSQARFLVVSDVAVPAAERPEGLPPEAYQVVLPACSTDVLRTDIESCRKRIAEIEGELKYDVQYIKSLKDSLCGIAKDIEFENLYSGMGCEDLLSWITGYVPVDSMQKFTKCAKEQNWAFVSSDPAEDDLVPTKLKNSKLVSLIYPLTDFLGTVPGYHEYDISGWFLLFFTVFFGMIFGDGGYGAIVTAGALIFILKSVFSGKKVQPMLGLVLLLGVATMVWGAVTCTWFGLQPEQLPDWIVSLSVPPISNAYSDVEWLPFWSNDLSKGTLTTANNLQIFCFTLALIQLCVAHLKGMVRYRKSLKCIAEFGSLIELVGMYYIVLSMVVNSSIFSFSEVVYGIPVGTVSIGLVAFGFVLSFVFSNYEGSIVKSILESVKNIISVLLGVVNVFSDIVSYIRLWAVGLAGAAISGTVNEMAGPLVGHATLFLALMALLLFGHGLNMVLNLLSVIVHGVRLNTLEFSTHLGMSWSGFKYEPFAETVRK